MADLKSKKNVNRLLNLREKLRKKESRKAFKETKDLFRKEKIAPRTSKVRGDSFVLKGKPTSPKSINFTLPSGGELVKSTPRTVSTLAPGKELVKSPSRNITTTARSIPSKGARSLKALSKFAKFAGPAAGLLGALPEGVGEGSDIVGERELQMAEEFKRSLAPPSVQEQENIIIQEQIEQDNINIASAEQQIDGVKALAESKDLQIKIARQADATLPTSEATKVKRALTNPDAIVKSVQASQADQESGKEPSLKNAFMDAITFFLPTALGAGIGAAFEGTEGAIAGAESATQLSAAFRKEQFEKQKFEEGKAPSGIAQAKLKVSQDNLELRKQDIADKQKRTANLGEERNLRRDERDIDRAIDAKQSFGKRKDVENLITSRENLDDMESILADAPEIAAGVISFKIAKGIAKEVGNLTENERKDAQVSPSFLRRMERGGTKFLTGRLPEEDVKELNKVLNAMRGNTNSRLDKIVRGFTESRKKGFGKQIGDDFQQDLLNEFAIQKEKPKQESASQKIKGMSAEKRKRFEEFKARRNK